MYSKALLGFRFSSFYMRVTYKDDHYKLPFYFILFFCRFDFPRHLFSAEDGEPESFGICCMH